jgi:hypothetical protein
MYSDLLHSFSQGLFSCRFAQELSENALWDDQDDRRKYKGLVEKWGDKWARNQLPKAEVKEGIPTMDIKNIKPGGK